MANIGEQLLTPETGYQRIDCYDLYTNVNTQKTGTWINDVNTRFYNNTILHTKDETATLTFYLKSYKFRIISRKDVDRSENGKLIIDGSATVLNMNNDGSSPYIELNYDQNFSSLYHKIECIAGTDSYDIKFILDAIDIDDDGAIISEDEYLLGISKTAVFPVKVGGDSVTSETNVANYAKTLTNGERQLLLLNTGDMYLTDGNGGYIKMNDKEFATIDDENISTTTTYSSNKINENFATKEELKKVSFQQSTISLPSFGDPTV